MFSTAKRATIITACLTLVSTYAAAQGGLTQPKQGQGGSVVQGAAGTEGGVGDNGLEHCDKPMGAMAVVEPQNEILVRASTLQPPSPVGLDPHDDSAVELLHRRRARRWACRT